MPARPPTLSCSCCSRYTRCDYQCERRQNVDRTDRHAPTAYYGLHIVSGRRRIYVSGLLSWRRETSADDVTGSDVTCTGKFDVVLNYTMQIASEMMCSIEFMTNCRRGRIRIMSMAFHVARRRHAKIFGWAKSAAQFSRSTNDL